MKTIKRGRWLFFRWRGEAFRFYLQIGKLEITWGW